MVGGVAVIKVGAATETEMKEKKARVEDAMHATRAAVEEGIVAGGGVALRPCGKVLDNFKADERTATSRSASTSSAVLSKSRFARSPATPVRKARSSSAKSREGKDAFGFNAATEKYEDLVAAGVIDPAKVTRTALQNAASIAGLMLTTEAMIADIPEKRAATAAWAAWAAWTWAAWECNSLGLTPKLVWFTNKALSGNGQSLFPEMKCHTNSTT